MTNTEMLEKRISDSGKKKGFLAEKVGLSRAGFRNCMTNKAEFTASQIDPSRYDIYEIIIEVAAF